MFRRLGFVLLMGLVITLISTIHVPSVNAGTNGQQLRITYYRDGVPTRITVQGTNQYGSQATWSTSVPASAYCGLATVTTSGWWWKGTVRVTYTISGNRTKTCSFGVPSLYPSDVYPVQCS